MNIIDELSKSEIKFDLILDDGSHKPEDQLFFLNNYISHSRFPSDLLYIPESIASSLTCYKCGSFRFVLVPAKATQGLPRRKCILLLRRGGH